jgi:integrase
VHRGTTADQVASNLRNHILPTFKGRALASVRPSEVQGWVRDRSDVLAPATVEVVYRYLAAIFAAAVRDRLIARSPCVGIKLPRRDPSELRPATTGEVQAIAAAVPPRFRALVLLAASTGLRQGEAFGVILPNGDLDRAELRVDRQVVLRSGRRRTSHRQRPTPACGRSRSRLASRPSFSITSLISRPRFIRTSGSHCHDGSGGVAPAQPVRRGLAEGRPPVGCPGRPDLSRSQALLRVAAHRPRRVVKVVQRRLGHKTAQEKLDTYGHMWPDSDGRTREAVDSELLRHDAARATITDDAVKAAAPSPTPAQGRL